MTDVHRFKAQLVDDMVVAGLADGIAHVLRTVTGNNNLLVTVCQILSVFAYRSCMSSSVGRGIDTSPRSTFLLFPLADVFGM